MFPMMTLHSWYSGTHISNNEHSAMCLPHPKFPSFFYCCSGGDPDRTRDGASSKEVSWPPTGIQEQRVCTVRRAVSLADLLGFGLENWENIDHIGVNGNLYSEKQG